jgi:hypothetical protein
MPQLVYKPGQRRHLFAVRQLVADPKDEDSYVAGRLVAVYASNDAESVIRQVCDEDLVPPPYAVIHVIGYMLAIAHQGQEGFRVRIVEPDRRARWRASRAIHRVPGRHGWRRLDHSQDAVIRIPILLAPALPMAS